MSQIPMRICRHLRPIFSLRVPLEPFCGWLTENEIRNIVSSITCLRVLCSKIKQRASSTITVTKVNQ